MADQFDRPCAWAALLVNLQEFLQEDAGVADIVTKQVGGVDVVDVAQGVTPTLPAPCIRLCRGDEGSQPLSGWRWDWIPASLEIDIICCSQATAPRDKQLSAQGAWDALGSMEAVVLAACRRYFDPARDLEPILGAIYRASIKSIKPTDANYWPVVASEITIQLNKG